MTITPDRFPGEDEAEGLLLEAASVDPTIEGGVRYVSGSFRMKDSSGVFNPRTGGGAHGSTHNEDGSDELIAQDLGSGTATAGQLMQADGAGGWNLADYVPGIPPNLITASYTYSFTTAATTYQQAWRYTTPSIPEGSYFIAVQAWLDTTNAGNVTDARVQVDDTSTIAKWISPVGYVGGSTPLIGVMTVNLSAGIHNIDFDIRKALGNGSVKINYFYVTMWRVS